MSRTISSALCAGIVSVAAATIFAQTPAQTPQAPQTPTRAAAERGAELWGARHGYRLSEISTQRYRERRGEPDRNGRDGNGNDGGDDRHGGRRGCSRRCGYHA
jgi:hypothetical protein